MNDAFKRLTIISGGQTGVDRAALDVAIRLQIPHGGWCPLGRRAEDGPIDSLYALEETPSGDYVQRTEWNVRDSDATLILNEGLMAGGTQLTQVFAEKHGKPCLVLALDNGLTLQALHDWLQRTPVQRLNIAGPRESKCPGIYKRALSYLERALT